jgi:hypothetical protein
VCLTNHVRGGMGENFALGNRVILSSN